MMQGKHTVTQSHLAEWKCFTACRFNTGMLQIRHTIILVSVSGNLLSPYEELIQ
jgi:hypothetical protein